MFEIKNLYKCVKLLIVTACIVLILVPYTNSAEKPDKVEEKPSGNTKEKVDKRDGKLSTTTIIIKGPAPQLDWENRPAKGTTILSKEPDSPKTGKKAK
jgi:hypothetical protein